MIPVQKDDIQEKKVASISSAILAETELFNKEEQEEDDDLSIIKTRDISWKIKIVIVICMLIMPAGVHYMEATLSALKTELKENMEINNTQFSILMSSVTLVNTFLPLFAGAFADNFNNSIGTVRGTLIVSILIFIGSLMVTLGAIQDNFNIMLAGQIIYGLGDGIIVTFQEAILSRWFRDKQLAIVVGFMLCIARLSKFVAKLICYPLVNAAGGNYTRPITVAMVFCGISVLANIIYYMTMVKAGYCTIYGREIIRPNSGGYHTLVDNKFKYGIILYIPSIFWMIPWLQISMSSVLSSFDDVSTEYVQFRFSTSSITAGYTSSLTQAVPVIAAPLLGLYIHKYGQRLYILIIGTIILILALVLLAYTWVTPEVGMIFVSFALSFGPIALLSSTSFLLPTELAGIGVGLHKCGNNIGTTIIAIIVGYIQDLTYHDGDSADNQTDMVSEYEQVMIFYLAITGIGFLLSILFYFMDRNYINSWLQLNIVERTKRLELVKEIDLNTEQYKNALKMIGSKLRSKRTYVYTSIFIFWLVASWVIFFSFALMPVYQDYSDDF